jgi:CRISPR-associated endonuclease Cas1
MTRRKSDDNTVPIGLWPDANRLAVDPVEYDDSIRKYELMTQIQLRNSDTFVVSGYGVHLKVEYESLAVEYEQGHVPGRKKLLKLDRGVHKMKKIFICSHGGYVSFEAIEWCSQQEITVFLLNWKNDVVQVITPRQSRDARLVHLQYGASQSTLGVEIVREIIKRKTEQQIVALKRLSGHTTVRRNVAMKRDRHIARKPSEAGYSDPTWRQFEDGIENLAFLNDVDSIRMLEARLAAAYWSMLVGIPIRWDYSAEEKIPEHWLKVPERVSGISSFHNGSQATNPFYAVLNFAYALLKAQVLQSVLIAGLDETIGFLHVSREGNQAFVYDLMEPFRSLVDIKVLELFDKMIFKKGDFVQSIDGECRLNEGLRRYVVATCRVPNVEIDRFVELILAIVSGKR